MWKSERVKVAMMRNLEDNSASKLNIKDYWNNQYVLGLITQIYFEVIFLIDLLALWILFLISQAFLILDSVFLPFFKILF